MLDWHKIRFLMVFLYVMVLLQGILYDSVFAVRLPKAGKFNQLG